MGAIAISTIREFMQRRRSDFRSWKNMTAAELLPIRDRLPIRPPVWKVLRLHQKVCLLIGAYRRQFGFFLDTGMGKTFLIIALFSYWEALARHRKDTRQRRWLILVPNKTNKDEWCREMAKHAPHFSIVKLEGSTEAKWQTLADNPDCDFAVETYAGLMRMVSSMVQDERKAAKKKKDKKRLKWSGPRINQLCKLFDGLIMDESIKVMNKSALPHRICYQIRQRLEAIKGFAYELNGTPFGRDPEPIWGQVYLLDLGRSLGETLAIYRGAFFNEARGRWGELVYKFDKSKQQTLHNFLADRTIAYEADEGDLPAVVPIKKIIRLPEDAEAYAAEAARMVKAAKGNYVESKNAFNRMRQISSGWLGYKDDDTGERASVNFRPNAKLEYLMDYIDVINPKYKIIIFHEYNYSGKLITDALTAEKIRWSWLYGKTKDHAAQLRSFTDGDARVLVLSNSAGSYGLNLQIAKYGIYFEAPSSPIIRYQTRKRFERQESPHKTVFRIDLVVEGTYDQTILDWHDEGKDLFDGIIRGKFKSRQSGELAPAGE